MRHCELDRASVNLDSPFYERNTANIEVIFNDEPQRNVIEYCVSEGWICRFKRDWRGKAVKNGQNYVAGARLTGKVEVFWKN